MGNISQTPFIPAPFVLANPGYEHCVTPTAVTAGAAYLIAVDLLATITISQMRTTISGTPTGNIDMGIYDATGTNNGPNNLLGHTGANAAVTGQFTKSLTANLTLNPGQYWIAILDTVADQITARVIPSTGFCPNVRTVATNLTVLPSTIGSVANNNTEYGVCGLILNSFS